jgi:DNA topoisomerase-1
MVKTILVIVESPAKCKKIEKFLSKRKGITWIVKASFGHINELKPSLKDSIDIKHDFNPSYQISESKKKVVRELSKISNKKDVEVIIATDPDREGEAIGYHLINELNLDLDKTKRIFFNQITEKAVLNSLDNATKINMDLVNSQQARCILDKLVGYEISPVLWRHIKMGLSAGRCQSPALRILSEREDKYKDFSKSSFFKLSGDFKFNNFQKSINFICDKEFNTDKKIKDLLEKFKDDTFTIKDIKTTNSKRTPPSPFTTSSLQQDASSKLGICPKECMMVAQKLYEGGYITYMRTDSIDLSNESKDNIKDYINNKYGSEYHYNAGDKGNRHKNKSKNSQEAHEAIRPVDVNKVNVPNSLTGRAQKLYQLIWKRTVASQMETQKIEINTISIVSQTTKEIFVNSIDKVLFYGYGIVYKKSDDDDDNENLKLISKISKGDKVTYNSIKAEEKYTRPISRYTEASLIKELERLGIGRPSTYSSIITKIQDKAYVEKKSVEGEKVDSKHFELTNKKITEKKEKFMYGADKGKLFVTPIGLMVNTFLLEHFSNEENTGMVDYNMTSDMETKLDKIAEGKGNWVNVIDDIYNTFHPTVEDLLKSKTKEKDKFQKALGKDTDDLEVGITVGRNGPVVYKKSNDFKTPWKFANIEDFDPEDITLDEAIKLLIFPKNLGKVDKKDVIVKKGTYGPYLSYNSKFFSIDKDKAGTITLKEAQEIISGNPKDNPEDIIGKHKNINIIFKSGKFGNYLSYNNKNFSLNNKTLEKEDVSLEDAIELINKKNKLIIKEFNKELSIRIGKRGPYIMVKKEKEKGKGKGKPEFISIPKGEELEKLSKEDCERIIENNKKKII